MQTMVIREPIEDKCITNNDLSFDEATSLLFSGELVS